MSCNCQKADGKAGNGVACPNCCGFHAVITSGVHSVTPGVDFAIPLATELFDEGNFYNTGTFLWTPPASLVTIEGTVDLLAVQDQEFIRAVVYKNGSEYKFGSQVAQNGNNTDPRSVISFIDLAGGADTYQLFVHLNVGAGGNRTIENSASETYFSGACLGVSCVPEA